MIVSTIQTWASRREHGSGLRSKGPFKPQQTWRNKCFLSETITDCPQPLLLVSSSSITAQSFDAAPKGAATHCLSPSPSTLRAALMASISAKGAANGKQLKEPSARKGESQTVRASVQKAHFQTTTNMEKQMNIIRLTIDFDTINVDADTLKARILECIELGELTLEENLKESCDPDPDTVTVTVID